MAKARRGRKRDAARQAPAPDLRSAHVKANGSPKRAYASEAEALSVADEQRWENGVQLSAYRCPVCTAWHLGGRREA